MKGQMAFALFKSWLELVDSLVYFFGRGRGYVRDIYWFLLGTTQLYELIANHLSILIFTGKVNS